MAIGGLSHITLIVADLDRAARFFCDGLGGEEIYDSEGQNFSLSREKFFMVGGIWFVTMLGEPTGDQGYQHIALQAFESELPEFQARLESIGVTFKPSRPRVAGEGLSLYFYDFDGHLFELHTGTLRERLNRYE